MVGSLASLSVHCETVIFEPGVGVVSARAAAVANAPAAMKARKVRMSRFLRAGRKIAC
jgi:hypothetical protein